MIYSKSKEIYIYNGIMLIFIFIYNIYKSNINIYYYLKIPPLVHLKIMRKLNKKK